MASDGLRVVDLEGGAAGGAWLLLSASSTTYAIDQRGDVPSVMRVRGAGNTGEDPLDNRWLRLLRVEPYDDGWLTPEQRATPHEAWVLMVGRRHRLVYELPGGNPLFDGFWVPRTLEGIEVLDEMPELRVRTRGPDEVDFSDGPQS
ncbi:hypothetical protein [Demequina globuliformis]|uniref:hypothetical protein n=1 Tax=Demequina globuliformis TaxID=676202 RepID=UPI000782EF3E|nr:hypothetical protein [Demequina globuliformis]